MISFPKNRGKLKKVKAFFEGSCILDVDFIGVSKHYERTTPPKINMEHNNGGLEDDFPFQIGDF